MQEGTLINLPFGSTAAMAVDIPCGGGDVKTDPATAADSIPLPTYPNLWNY